MFVSILELAKELDKGLALSHASIVGSSDQSDQDVLSLKSSDPAD